MELNGGNKNFQIHQRNASDLAAGYLSGFRKIEILSIVAFCTMSAMILRKLTLYQGDAVTPALLSFFLGWISADFVSGFVHWLGDTWGNADWPIVGKTLIRTFREHHVDQKAITRHDFVETNGSNCMVSLPALILALALPLSDESPYQFFCVAYITSLTLWVFATNQIHKWSHQDEPLRIVRWLQKTHLILPPVHHSQHHAVPYAKYYCITTGWLNWPLTRIQFFPRLEKLIMKVTGAVPRQDDVGKSAAISIMKS